MPQVFEAVRVVELSTGMAGAMLGGILADYGAEVVKVEPPGGDWARRLPGWRMWNRGKTAITVNLEDVSQRREVAELVDAADVLITSSSREALARWGLDLGRLRSRAPRLVVLELSGFGPVEHLGRHKGYEGIVSAKAGRYLGTDGLSGAVVPDADSRPVFQAAPVASFGAAMLGLQGVASALMAREDSGRGALLATSLLEGASAATMRLRFQRDGDSVRLRSQGSDLVYQGILLTFLTARCSDGKYIQMCARQDNHFREWMQALDLSQIFDDPRFAGAPLGLGSRDDIDELRALIEARMSTKSRDEWMDLFQTSFDVGADPFMEPQEYLDLPDMLQNDRVVTIEDTEVGTTRQVGQLSSMTRTPPQIHVGAPSLRPEGATIPTRRRPSASGAVSTGGARLPLEGVTILEFATFLAGPLATTMLAELGARVIKVEPLTGDAFRRTGIEFAHLAAGKESIALDLKHPDSAEIVERLIERSNAVIHNFRPRAAARLKLDFESLSANRPDLVHLHAASYGSRGPQANRAAFHSTPNAMVGGGFLQAGRGNPPVDDSYPDPCAGLAAGAALAMGLYAQRRFGIGQALETTMLTAAGYVHSNDVIRYSGRPAPAISDSGQHGPHALYRLYETADGWLFLATPRDEEWQSLIGALPDEGLEHPMFADAAQRRENDDALAEVLARTFARRPAATWEAELHKVGVTAVECSRVGFEEFVVENDMVHPVSHPDFEDYFGMRPRIRNADAATLTGQPCGLGEHTIPLLEELGYGTDQTRDLAARGVVGLGTARSRSEAPA